MEGYVAAKVFAEGLRRAGKGVSRDMLIAALESMQSVDMGGFLVNYGARRHVASQYVDLTMLTEFGGVRV
jgi:branched-chain amino acid transport system substrate-binding protein